MLMFNNSYGVSSCVWEQMDTGRQYTGEGDACSEVVHFVSLAISVSTQ